MNSAPSHDTVVEVEDLVAHYGETLVLEGVSYEVRRGEVLVILGSSGCGKSTLLKHTVGLLRPTSGRVNLLGETITDMDEEGVAAVRAKLGISFQSGGLFNSMTVGENIAMPLLEHRQKFDPVIVRMIVRLKLGLVGLGDAEHKMPSELSGGMLKRAGLARALALDPEILFFDEPSAGLDPVMAAGLDQLILELRDLLGLTMVIVTHELDSIRTIADRVLMLGRGQRLFFGPLAEAEQSEQPDVRQFFQRIPDERLGRDDD